jgi:ferredoxin
MARIVSEPAGVVPYASAGSLLIIGEASQALAVAEDCKELDDIRCSVLVTGADVTADTLEQRSAGGITIIKAAVKSLSGYLGTFQLTLLADNGDSLISEVTQGRGLFDLVLDLGAEPLIDSEIPPPGYFTARDEDALRLALEEIPELVGEFEKPKFFNYDASICAHGRSGMTACSRCLQACPTDAIHSLGDTIEVDPGLCQGAGSCATACPTGAITYNYPRPGDSLDRLRTLLKQYREQGGQDPVLLFHDGMEGLQTLSDMAARLPEQVLPVEVEEIGSIGMDTWLAALAYGASSVVLLGHAQVPGSVDREIQAQLATAHALLAGMGYDAGLVGYTDHTGSELLDELSTTAFPERPAAGFAGMDDKRTVIRFAVDHLFTVAPRPPRPLVTLPTGAPFGEVLLDQARCTLCMACVSQCPANALSAGDESPQLGFIEANCVQCGLCCRTCPEDAISISPRYLYDFPTRNSRRILYEEEPFTCISCGKPFATRSVIENIIGKMQGHAMFQGDALKRIKMCEDCRVRDIYGDEDGDAQIRVDPAPGSKLS